MINKSDLKFFDPQIELKQKAVGERLQFIPKTQIPIPSEVEISESGMCNRKCHFCPRSDPDFEHKNEFIEFSLFKKLCDELKELTFAGLFIFSGFVEPLLDKNIYKLISYAKKVLPKARIEIITNGDVLNLERLKKLFDSGLNTILISVYDSKEDADKFEKLCVDAKLEKEQFVIRHRYLPPEMDYGITMSNRAGMMKDAEVKINPLKESLKLPCYYPSYTFFMDYNGDVLMCPHDWGKKIVLGNLNKKSFKDIWISKTAINIRKKLVNLFLIKFII